MHEGDHVDLGKGCCKVWLMYVSTHDRNISREVSYSHEQEKLYGVNGVELW